MCSIPSHRLSTLIVLFDSWSPDGAHITAANATNNNGYVFIAAVIARNSWTSEISLVGHENTVEVAVRCVRNDFPVTLLRQIDQAYNPHIFLRDPSLPVVASNICSVVALGADDRSVSVWQTKSARPLVVAKEVFERQIMDLSWCARSQSWTLVPRRTGVPHRLLTRARQVF